MYAQIKLIDKDTDLTKLQKYDWDAVLGDLPLQVYRLEGYIHTIGGREGFNDRWCCPRNEEPTYQNLMEFSGHAPSWGIVVEESNYSKTKWDETEVRASCKCFITRNGKKFFEVNGNTMDYCLNHARQIIWDLESFPIGFGSIKWREEIEGRKIFWKDQPAIITRYIDGGRLVIKATEPQGFKVPPHHDEEADGEYFEDNMEVVDDLFTKSIYWFRK